MQLNCFLETKMVSVATSFAFDGQTSLAYTQAGDGSQSLTLRESLSATLVEQAADGSTHGEAVAIYLSFDAGTGVQPQPGAAQTVLDKLKQDLAAAKEFSKDFAAQSLQEALKELAILKTIGGRRGAEDLVRLAKRIASAAQNYSAGEQQLAASAPEAATATDSPQTAALPSAADTVGKPPDLFYQLAEGALGEIRKALKKILPELERAPDRKTRELARKLADEFNRSVSDTTQSEQDFSAAAPAAQAYEQANGISGPDLSSLDVGYTAASAPVDLSV